MHAQTIRNIDVILYNLYLATLLGQPTARLVRGGRWSKDCVVGESAPANVAEARTLACRSGYKRAVVAVV